MGLPLQLCQAPFFAGSVSRQVLHRARCNYRARWALRLVEPGGMFPPADPDALVCGVHRRALFRRLYLSRAHARAARLDVTLGDGWRVVLDPLD